MEVCEPIKMSPKKESLTSPTTHAKGLKQVRLPFKQLDQKIVSPVTSGKKRKLSNGESPASKITKTVSSVTPKSSAKPKTPVIRSENSKITNDENEVSSSSEADVILLQDGRKSKPRFIEKFLEAAQQREVSTSGEVIDLASESEEKECNISDAAEQEDKGKKVEMDTMEVVEVTEVKDASMPSNDKDTKTPVNKPTKKPAPKVVEVTEVKQDTSMPSNDKDTKTPVNKPTKKAAPKIEDLFSVVSKTPSSGKRSSEAMVTPAKVLKTAEMKTPGDKESPCEASSPSPSSSAVTPTSTVEKKAASLKKKQEKDLEKQKKKEEKEKEKQEKQKQRDEAKAEKERKKQEEKDKKEQERLQKEKEKQEKKDQAEREKQEKVKAKEEEKKKKSEVIEEEKRKKEEERKKKEDEKRQKEEEKKKDDEEKLAKAKKAKMAFTSFFIKSETSPTSKPANREATGLFRGFHINKDMTLAPSKRAHAQLEGFDTEFESQESGTLYLDELKGRIHQLKWTGKLKKAAINGEDEVIEVKDPEGDSAIEDASSTEAGCPKIMKAKFLKFKENNRPAYRGTWRKKSKKLTPRNPFKMDEDLFDYEYDSDDDWEEEEPGESLSDSEGEGEDDDEDKEDDDDEEDTFFVPHGYLSEGEGCDEEDEAGNPEKLKAMQVAKAKAFEMEMKRKCEYMKAIVIGCCWLDATDRIPEVYKRLEAYRVVPLSSTPIMTACNKPKLNSDAKPKSKGIKKKPVPDEAIPDLIKYVHGNISGIHKLVRGFRTQWHKKTNPQSTSETPKPEQADENAPNDPAQTPKAIEDNKDNTGENVETASPATEKIPESEHAMSIRQLEMKISSMAAYQKGPQHYRKCWYVKPEILKEHNLEELLEKVVKKERKTDKSDLNKSVDASQAPSATPEAATPKSKTTPSVTITQFTVKADPEAKWHLEKLPPKQAPATPVPSASPAPAASPSVSGKGVTRRIQLTTLNNFMKPKLAQSASPGVVQKTSSVEKGQNASKSSSSENAKPSQVVDLTEDLSNDSSPPTSGSVSVPPGVSTVTKPASDKTASVLSPLVQSTSEKISVDVEMKEANAVIVLE